MEPADSLSFLDSSLGSGQEKGAGGQISILLQHYFRGLDDGRHRVADLQLHFVGAAFRDHAFNQVFANAYGDMRHDAAELDFFHFSFELIAR